MCLQTGLILMYAAHCNPVKLLSKGTDKRPMKACEVAMWFSGFLYDGTQVIFVHGSARCEAVPDHEPNLISLASREAEDG